MLPVFLTGALSVQMRDDLHFSTSGLGGAIAVFFAASALTSMPAGKMAEVLGPTRAMRIACGASGLSSLGIASVAGSWGGLALLLALGGSANAFAQPSTNLLLARTIPAHRRGLAFGLKQGAIPLATLMGGLAVPLVALTVGWRWGFAGAAVLATVAGFVLPRLERGALQLADFQEKLPKADVSIGPLLVLGVGAGMGAASAGSLGGFLVDSGVASGLSKSAAGVLLAGGSAVNFATRMATGYAADRRSGGHFRSVSIMLLLGAGGYALLSTGDGLLFVLGSLIAFGAGWGWPSVFHYAVVWNNPTAPGAATGITQTGVYVGGFSGPMIFGALADRWSYGVAWNAAAVAVLAAAALVTVGRSLVRRERAGWWRPER